MIEKIKKVNRFIKVLNFFVYIGGVIVVCVFVGVEVCYVDVVKGMVNWVKENIELLGFKN